MFWGHPTAEVAEGRSIQSGKFEQTPHTHPPPTCDQQPRGRLGGIFENGVDEATIRRARKKSALANTEPEKHIGKDGKSYPAHKRKASLPVDAREPNSPMPAPENFPISYHLAQNLTFFAFPNENLFPDSGADFAAMIRLC